MKIIGIYYRDQEIGKLAFDEDTEKSYFQYNPHFLNSENFKPLFPFLLKKTELPQVFTQFKGDTFKSIPPMFADSLPDLFGNMVFKEWMNANNKVLPQLSNLPTSVFVAWALLNIDHLKF